MPSFSDDPVASWWRYLLPLPLSTPSSGHFPSISATSILVLVVLFLLLLFFVKRVYDFRSFQRCGIPGPAPNFFLGNLRDLDDGSGTKEGFLNLDRKFGSTSGIFFGDSPHILTSDPEVIKRVFVKDFALFPNRQLGVIPPTKKFRNLLIGVHYERWRPIRSIMSPFFTAAKLRKMGPKLQQAVDAFAEVMDEKLEEEKELELDIVPWYQRLALDAINLSAFGLNVNSQREKNGILDAALNLVRGVTANSSLKVFLCLMCQQLVPIVHFFNEFIHDPVIEPIQNVCLKIVKSRKAEAARDPETASKRDDLIKIMMDYETDKIQSEDEKKLTESEIALQAQVLIIGGFETTSRTLSYITFQLALHPDIQTRLYEELSEAESSTGTLTYDDIASLEFLNGVICETLRLCPPAPFGVTSRIASRDVVMSTSEGKEFQVKKGVQVSINMWALHFNPEIWPEPERFDPDRFSKSASLARDPVYFLPFGYGSRNCIGQRFAMTEMKMTLATLVRRYEMLPSPKGKLTSKMMDFGYENVVDVKFRKRVRAED